MLQKLKSPAKAISKLTVHSQYSGKTIFFICNFFYFVNVEVWTGCSKLGHTTLPGYNKKQNKLTKIILVHWCNQFYLIKFLLFGGQIVNI